jgi:hypothetical protein
MHGAVLPLPNTLSWNGAESKESTGVAFPYLTLRLVRLISEVRRVTI